MRDVNLSQWAQVTLDANGNGTASAGPTSNGETWTAVTAAVHAADNTSEATCRFYVGSAPSPQFFAGGTTWGSTGDNATWSGVPIAVGQRVYAVWSGGTPGTTAYLTLSGTASVA